MPEGAYEEEVALWGTQSNPIHVVSSDAKPGKHVAAEFGRWRTVVVSSAIGPVSTTPGAQRLANRSLRRNKLHILVDSTGPIATAATAVTAPGVPATGVAAQNTNAFPVSVVINANGATISNVSVNGLTVGSAAGTYLVPAFGSISIAYTVAVPTWTWSTLAGSSPQPVTDGVIVGSREEINSGQPATPGSLGGYIQIGDNVRWECQAELWVCYPTTNVGPVYVTVCDEQFASDPEAYKEWEK